MRLLSSYLHSRLRLYEEHLRPLVDVSSHWQARNTGTGIQGGIIEDAMNVQEENVKPRLFIDSRIQKKIGTMRQCFEFHPILHNALLDRGFNLNGITFVDFVQATVCIGWMWGANMLFRVMMHRFRLGRFKPRPPSPQDAYSAIFYSSLVCFLEPESGNLVMNNTKFFSSTAAAPTQAGELFIKQYSRIEVVLNHEKRIVESMIMDVGPTRKIVLDQNEIITIIVQLFSFKSHVHCHWLANGVTDLKGIWPLAEKCSVITEWINTMVQFFVILKMI